jgi:hypothetical protein
MASRYSTSFDLSLMVSKLDSGSYPIFAYSNRLGKSCTASLPQAEARVMEEKAQQLRLNPLPTQDLQDFGRQLFEALIRQQVRDMFRTLEGQNTSGLNLHLVLNLQPQLLQRLPWECMWDPYHAKFLSLQTNTHIIRKVQMPQEAALKKASPGYSNLVIAIASPRGMPPLNPQRERDLIDLAVGELHQEGLLNRRFIQGSQDEIRTALSHVPNVFHFVGHGGLNPDDIPGLYLEDSNGDYVFVTASELEYEYFTPPPGVDRRVDLVILSACQTSATPITEGYSSLAHRLLSQVDTVLAMQYPIGLDNLTEFNTELYRALANGAQLEIAVSAARRKIITDRPGGLRDWVAPVLVTRQDAPENLLQLISKNPFKGPLHYDLTDRECFFGREAELRQLDELYQKQDVVVIRGDCGCGKTSLLKAGWMPGVISGGEPLVYISVSEDLEAQLRLEINKLLTQEERKPLPEGELDQLTGLFPSDLVIILDRVEQVELLGEQVEHIANALIQWAINPTKVGRRSHLLIATRLNERGEEPLLLQQMLPEDAYPRLELEMLDDMQARLCIEASTRKTNIVFLPATIQAILDGLHYNQPEQRNMMALQVVCRVAYQRALELQRKEVTPELLRDLNDVDGILDREFKLATKLNQSVYTGGEAARKVLAQFVSSDRLSMRPRSWDELLLRCCMDERELGKTLDILQEDGLVRLEQHPGGEKYELVHETLIRQIDWFSGDEVDLRRLEELVESAHTLIPLRSEKGGLEALDAHRDALILSTEQLALLLRSALEAGHAVDYWFSRIPDSQQALSVLTSPYLGVEAQERACHLLGQIGAQEGEPGKIAQDHLWGWACASESPRVSQAASLALAPFVDEVFLNRHFSAQDEGLERGEIAALAIMYDSHWLPLKSLPAAARRQIRLKILHNNSVDILSSVLRAAALGAAGFALAAVWNFTQTYIGPDHTDPPALLLLILQLSLIGLLVFILALPAALCAPLGRDLWTLLAGGRRRLPAALGTLAGSALGVALTVLFLAALAEYKDPSWVRLLRYSLSGALIGTAVGLPWLVSAHLTLKRFWPVLLAGLCGALVFLGVSLWESWWPQHSFALSLDGRYSWVTRVVPGLLIGLGSALGLAWGRLRKRV